MITKSGITKEINRFFELQSVKKDVISFFTGKLDYLNNTNILVIRLVKKPII